MSVRSRVGRAALGRSDCEQIRDRALRQPVNAITSVSYLAAGASVAAQAMRAASVHRVALSLYAASLTTVGVGSIAYHGPQPPWATRFHDGSIVASLAAAVLVVSTAPRTTPGPLRRRPVLLLTTLSAAVYRAGRSESRWCDPDSLVQLHAVWHLLSAVSAAALARTHSGPRVVRCDA